ncbi:MAG TPA: hypothetical protein VKX30_08690 [Flavobacteriaceae bacterium]|nr:hypothetical protein [Flavobacteriaceae bacterium]
MKYITAFVITIALAFGACNKEDNTILSSNSTCDFETIVSSIEYRNAPLAYLVINSF